MFSNFYKNVKKYFFTSMLYHKCKNVQIKIFKR